MLKTETNRSTRAPWGALLGIAGLLGFVAAGAAAEGPVGPPSMADAHASLMPARVPVQVEQIQGAVGDRISLSGARLRLPAPMTAASSAPEFELTAVAPWGDRAARLRIACRRHEECRPFYLAAEWPSAAEAKAAIDGAKLQGPAPRKTSPDASPSIAGSAPLPVRNARLVSEAKTGREREAVTASSAGVSSQAARAGSRATLVLSGDRLHIKVPVICLETGEPGRTIRVTAADHKQTYSAEVVDPTLLKGTL